MIDKAKYEAMLSEVITPRYVYKIFDIGAHQGAPLRGNDIKEHLRGCTQIILLAVTIGLAVDELIRRTQAHDMAGAVILDELAGAAADRLADEAELEIDARILPAGALRTARFSPGYGDFPLTVQGDLLRALGAQKQIGVHVSESDTLIPCKSITAVIGIKK